MLIRVIWYIKTDLSDMKKGIKRTLVYAKLYGKIAKKYGCFCAKIPHLCDFALIYRIY